MADTTFVDNETVVTAAWLNAVNDLLYDALNGASTAAEVLTALDIDLTDIDADDNTAEAFKLREDTNNYILLDTTDGSEVLNFGNSTTNPKFYFLGTGIIDLGDYGSEEDGTDFNGTTYSQGLRINDIGGSNPAHVVIHRHSTTLQPLVIGTRSVSDDNSHTAVSNDDTLFSIFGAGWSGSHYDFFGEIRFEVPSSGTVSATSVPGQIVLAVCPNGSQTMTDQITIVDDLVTINANTLGATDINVSGDLVTSGTFTSLGIDDNGPDNIVVTFSAGDHYTMEIGAAGVFWDDDWAVARTGTWGACFGTLGSGESGISNNVYVPSTTTDDEPIGNGDCAKLVLNEGGSGGEFAFYSATSQTTSSDITWTELLTLAEGGALFGEATGGAQGAGTINAKGFYVDGTQIDSGAASGAVLAAASIEAGGASWVIQPSGWGTISRNAAGNATVTHNYGSTDYEIVGGVLINGQDRFISIDNKAANTFDLYFNNTNGGLDDIASAYMTFLFVPT